MTDNGDTYALVQKDKKPPKPLPPNLPDVTYAEVNKKKEVSAPSRKPKKYKPPSAVADEDAYEDVKVPDSMKKSKSGGASSGYEEVNIGAFKKPAESNAEDTYESLGQKQDDDGRTVNEEGLIYAEVSHLKAHPPDKPPIQTEESTEYASLDFMRMKPDVASN